jgi:hypothetical protein
MSFDPFSVARTVVTMPNVFIRTEPSHWFWGTLALLAVTRVIAVAFYSPTGFPDRLGYLNYSDIILSGTQWLHTLEKSHLPTTSFRAMGYPIILTGLRIITGTAFDTAIQVLQCGATLLSCALLFKALRALLHSDKGACIAVLGFGLSVNLAYELSILPDAFSIAAWTAIVATGLSHWMLRRPLSLWVALGLSLLGLYIVMARGNGLHLLLLALPMLWLACLHTGARVSKRLGLLILPLLPGLIAYQLVCSWNEYRTGERFFTTGGQIALVQPVFAMERLGAMPFSGTDDLSQLYRQRAPERLYEQIYEVNQALYIDFNMSPNQISQANIALYLRTVRTHPGSFILMFFDNFDDKFAMGLVNPAFGLHEAHRLATGARIFPGFSSIVKGKQPNGLGNYLFAGLYIFGMVPSILLFAAAVLLTPFRVIGRIRNVGLDRETLAILTLWMVCLAVLAYYCALFMELRYVIMTSPFLIAIGYWSLSRRSRVCGAVRETA